MSKIAFSTLLLLSSAFSFLSSAAEVAYPVPQDEATAPQAKLTAKKKFEQFRESNFSHSEYSCDSLGKAAFMTFPDGKVIGYIGDVFIDFKATRKIALGVSTWTDKINSFDAKIEDDNKHDASWELYGNLSTPKENLDLVCHKNPKKN